MIKQGLFNSHWHGLMPKGPIQNPGIMPPMWGQVKTTNKNWTADVRLFTGEVLLEVPYPAGGIVDIQGNAHGRIGGLLDNMRVLVEFPGGNASSAVIVAIYPFFARQQDKQNIEQFQDEDLSGSSPTDFADYHKSGYRSKWKSLKIIWEKIQSAFSLLELDFDLGQLTLNGHLFVSGHIQSAQDPSGGPAVPLSLRGEVVPGSPQPAVRGTELNNELTKILAITAALTSACTSLASAISSLVPITALTPASVAAVADATGHITTATNKQSEASTQLPNVQSQNVEIN